MQGKPITKAEDVCKLATAGKCIYHSRWGRRVPAAFMQNMQLRFIVGQIRMGWLYHYSPEKITKKS